MSGLTGFLVNMFGPKAVINAIEQQNPEELASDVASLLDKLLDDQFGVEKSEKIQVVLVPFIEKFCKSLNVALLADQPTGDN